MKTTSFLLKSIKQRVGSLCPIALFTILLLCANIAQAQDWSDGDIITISNAAGTRFLKASSTTAITNISNAPDFASLWRVHVLTGGYYRFQNISNDRYLYASGTSSLALTNTITGNNANYSQFSIYHYNNGTTTWLRSLRNNYYININGISWTLNNSTTSATNRGYKNLSFETFTLGAPSLVLNRTSYVYTAVGTQTFTPTWSEKYIGGSGTEITASSAAVSTTTHAPVTGTITGDNRFVITATSPTANGTFTVMANTGATSARLNVSAKYTDGKTYTAVAQLYYNTKFIHQNGLSKRGLINNGKGIYMQGTHVLPRTIYVKPGDAKTLELPVDANEGSRMAAYYRWYNYDTDQQIGTHTTTTETTESELGVFRTSVTYPNRDNYGRIVLSNSTTSASPGTSTFTANTSFTRGNSLKIACDASNYIDFNATGGINSSGVISGIFTEPTLSYRLLYEIRSAYDMADELSQCTGEKFLEEYEIEAPVNATAVRFGPQYRYDGSESNYFYGTDATQITTGKWWKRESGTTNWSDMGTVTIVDNRLLQITGESDGTWEYKLTDTSGTYNIAHFTVEYKNINEIGPRADGIQNFITDDKILLAQQRFDYNDGMPYVSGTKATYYYDNPLPWSEIAYGFRYNTDVSTKRHPNRRDDWPNWSEYNLIRRVGGQLTAGWLNSGIENRSGVANGYFLYVDAGVPADKIADISVDGHLCDGTVLYFSAWVANITTHTTLPNLLFVLTGFRGGQDYELERYTTGNIGTTTADRYKWHQVLYEMKIPEGEDYDNYTIRVYNNGDSSSGNDFAFDDFQIYMSIPPTESMQVLSDCATAEGNEEIATLILEVDYLTWFENNDVDVDAEDWSGILYYRWEDKQYNPVALDSYIGRTPGQQLEYGQIRLTRNGDGVKDIYENFSAFFQRKEGFTESDYFFYWFGEGENRRPMLCIVQRSSVFEKGADYYSAVATTAGNLNKATCANKSLISVKASADITIRGNINVSQLCSGYKYFADIAFFTNDSQGKTIEGSGKVDWFEIIGEYDQAEIDEIERCLAGFRTRAVDDNGNIIASATAYPDETETFDKPVVPGIYTQEMKDYLLARKDKFSLYTTEVEFEISDLVDKVTFMTYPISHTVKPKEGSYTAEELKNLVFCPEPVKVEFETSTLGNAFEDVPEDIAGLPANVRLTKEEANSTNNEDFNLPVYFAQYSGQVFVEENTFILYESDDPSFNNSEPNNPTEFEYTISGIDGKTASTNNRGYYLLSSGDNLVLKSANASAFELKEGYTYSFKASLGIENGNSGTDCAALILRFNAKVVPDLLYWSPQTVSNAWNKDENWYMKDGDTYRQGFVPMNHSNVVVPTNNVISGTANTNWPMLPPQKEGEHATESEATPYITYDIYYQKGNCKQILFEPKTLMLNQYTLEYGKAWVDILIPNERYVWMSAPMQDVYAGDYYVRKNSKQLEEGLPFSLDETGYSEPDNRWYNAVWHFLYNTTSVVKSFEREFTYENIGWVEPTNVMNVPYTPGKGFRLWVSAEDGYAGSSAEMKVRLPKSYTSYVYYDDYDNPTNVRSTQSKTNYQKLGFEPVAGTDATDKRLFQEVWYDNKYTEGQGNPFILIGNPMMAYLDVNQFLETNTHLSKTIYLQGEKSAVSTTENTNEEGLSVVKARNIAPMESFLVEVVDLSPDWVSEDGKIKVIFSTDMDSYLIDLTTQNTLRSGYAAQTESKLYIKAEQESYGVKNTSSALLAVSNYANDDFVTNEDAEMVSFDSAYNPISVFTHADNKALSINMLQSLEGETRVPLTILLADGKASGKVDCYFSGVNSFNDNLYLYDAKLDKSTLIEEGTNFSLDVLSNETNRYYISKSPGQITDVDDMEKPEAFKAYAYNHSDKKATVAANQKIKHIYVYNSMGKAMESHLNIFRDRYELSFPQAGVYLIQIATDKDTITEKIIIK